MDSILRDWYFLRPLTWGYLLSQVPTQQSLMLLVAERKDTSSPVAKRWDRWDQFLAGLTGLVGRIDHEGNLGRGGCKFQRFGTEFDEAGNVLSMN